MFLRLDHAGISVRDMERAIRFYEEIIGMEKVFDQTFETRLADIIGYEGAKARVVHMRLGDSVVELFDYQNPKGRIPPFTKNQSDFGLIHIGFLVRNFHKTYEMLKQKGVQFLGEPVEIRENVFVAYFHGVEFEIIEMREIQGTH